MFADNRDKMPFNRSVLLHTLAIFLLVLQAGTAHAGQKLRVFFIGNSYTYYNNMPQMVADIATNMGDTLIWSSHTPGGYRLIDHNMEYNDSICINQIKTQNWDYIILQEQSQMPSREIGYYYWQSFAYARSLDTIIRNHAPCSKQMLYMTWGYKWGDSSYCINYNYPAVCTFEGMDSLTRLRYMFWADSLNTAVSPVGAVRRYIRQHYPLIELYENDGSHPTLAGSYVAAMCFYAALFKKDPTWTSYNSTLSAADANNIKNAVKLVLYDSLATWHLGEYELQAGFSYIQSGNMVNFNSTSTNAYAYNWNFGDGSTSTLSNPTHTYASLGLYTVGLTVYDSSGNCSNTSYHVLNMFPAGVKDPGTNNFTLSSDPQQGRIGLLHKGERTETYNVRIHNSVGQQVYLYSGPGKERLFINTSELAPGMYVLTVYQEGRAVYRTRFFK